MSSDRERLAGLEFQVKRMVSDMESEKRHKKTMTDEIKGEFDKVNLKFDRVDVKLDKLSKFVYMGLGIAIAVNFLTPIAIALLKK